jgi:hypothetical protein
MISEMRRSKRYNDFIAVSVVALNGINGNKVAGPFSGRIINVSRNGACVLMSLGVLDAYQVYSLTQKNDSSFIEISGRIESGNTKFKLSGRPIWSDPIIIDDIRAFKMGVDFMVNPHSDTMDSIINTVSNLSDELSEAYSHNRE